MTAPSMINPNIILPETNSTAKLKPNNPSTGSALARPKGKGTPHIVPGQRKIHGHSEKQ